MTSATVQSDGKFEQFAANINSLPRWMPGIVRKHMGPLGRTLQQTMRDTIAQHRYTGALEQSITSELRDGGQEVHIFPTAKRGRWDAGTILELGAPNARPPWAAIKPWADFRGLPAFPIWYSMTVLGRGVKAHPFLERTKRAGERAMLDAARDMVMDAAHALVSGTGGNAP